MKVKKTDLPVLPQETEVLPALDDATDADNSEDDDDEDDIDDDEDEDMLGDEPIESDDDEYDSEEDFDADKEPDTGSAVWDSFSTPQTLLGKDSSNSNMNVNSNKKDSSSTAASSTTEKATEIPTTPVTAIPTPDPYFTHFDPRYEHQSFKVCMISLV